MSKATVPGVADPKALCLRLMQADSQEQVVDELNKAGLWQDAQSWKLFDPDGTRSATRPAGGRAARVAKSARLLSLGDRPIDLAWCVRRCIVIRQNAAS
jgi:hypothetical protein